jgi:hemoglobin/transferrin/lactoferrin receptor protein
MKYKSLVIASILLSQNIKADDDSVVEIDSTVVVANKQLRPIQDIIGDVTLITSDNIANTNSEDIADALRYESNIHIEDAGTRFGTTGVNIRGIGKNRVAIEVDGTPNNKQFGIGSYSNAGTDLPETDLIKSIEILNGPASTLYGSDAIGGIVSIQTWNPEDLTSKSDDSRFNKIRLGYDRKRHARVITGITAWDSESLGGVISATHRDGKGLINHDDFHDSRDFSDWDEQSLFSKFVTSTGNGNSIKFGFKGSQRDNDTQINSFIGQGRFSRTTELLAEDQSKDFGINFEYDFSLNSSVFDDGLVRVFYADTKFEQDTYEKRSSRSGTPLAQWRHFEFEQQRTGLELNLNKSFSTDSTTHNIVYGLEIVSSDVEELRNGSETNLTTNVTNPIILGEVFPRRDFPNSTIQEIGLFMLDEIKFENSNWTIIPAIRFDNYDLDPSRDALFDANGSDTEIVSLSESDISPKLGALYEFNDTSNLYLQYVRGFRAPPFDDVNIGLNIPVFNIRAIANPDLKSEHSNGFEVGYRYYGDEHSFNLTAFNTDYSDFIETKARIGVDPETGTLLFQSRNIDEANIYGVEFDYAWAINDQWSTGLNYAWTKGENEITNEELDSISPSKTVVNLNWNSSNDLWNAKLYASFIQSKSSIDEDLFETPSYQTLDLMLHRKISDNMNLSIGVFNIFDEKYWNWQQVRNFDANDQIINSMSQPSRNFSISYSLTL